MDVLNDFVCVKSMHLNNYSDRKFFTLIEFLRLILITIAKRIIIRNKHATGRDELINLIKSVKNFKEPNLKKNEMYGAFHSSIIAGG
jgi:hypothetical protein